jgi:hypothetical protein
MAAQEDSLLSPITAAADRSESTTLLVAKVNKLNTSTVPDRRFMMQISAITNIGCLYSISKFNFKLKACKFDHQQTEGLLYHIISF